ncbi:MAG: DUF3048 domain-containing protein, partial [Actinomycetota bacterium]|nr:DUF3048 domain-containing protein [Actinomycetota bacterium]
PEPPPVGVLTGAPLPEPPARRRPIVAVKIDNAPRAVPQDGLDVADVVFEEEVEGGITRFVALYQSRDPGEVGPVRSGREADAVLLPAFEPVVAISGAAPNVIADLADADLLVFKEGQAGAFRRRPGRRAPHNLYADVGRLWAAGDALTSPDEPLWAFVAKTPPGGDRVAGAALTFSPFASAAWRWSPAQRVWQRRQDGSVHATAGGEQLTADNVVVMRVTSAAGDRVDSAGNPTVSIDFTGRGEAVVLRDGRAYDARWRKRSARSRLRWLDKDGDPFPLAPGRTWVEVLPTGAGFDLRGR